MQQVEEYFLSSKYLCFLHCLMIGEHTLPAVACEVLLLTCFTCTVALYVQLYVLHVDRFDQKSNPLLICITCTFVLDLIIPLSPIPTCNSF